MSQHVFITGASRGIGLALAKSFLEQGWVVYLNSRSIDALKQAADQLNVPHENLFPADLAKESEREKLYQSIAERGIKIDCLVNNAGIGDYNPLTQASPDTVNTLLQLNIVALTELSQFFANAFKAVGKGWILNVASTAAYTAGPGMASYFASKAYVLSLSHALYYELKAHGVTVSVLCPGPTDTSFFEAAGIDHGALKHAPRMTSKSVADIAIKGMLRGEKNIVPGLLNKLSVWLMNLSPRWLLQPLLAFLVNRQRQGSV
ncbi:MAG: SDR family oxidoreductase [Pseudobacteriovorax sp.]|nr:SDR family oxidoreductase [Pseudobacteriovorax sp.]